MKMNKLFIIPVALMSLLASCKGGSASKNTYELTYELNEDKVSYAVTGITYSNLSESALYDVVIPDTYNNLPVTALGKEGSANIFYNDKLVKSVKMSNNIKKCIGKYPFNKCDNLEKITFSENLTEVDEGGLILSCNKLNELKLPETLLTLTEDFVRFTGIKKLILPKNLELVPHNCFSQNFSLKDVIWPEVDFKIMWTGFTYCGFEELIMPDNMIIEYGLGPGQFGANEKLTKVVCGKGVSNNQAMFGHCPNLVEFYMNKETSSMSYYGGEGYNSSFHHCDSLREIHYESTMEDFDKVKKEPDWYKSSCHIERVICSDGTIVNEF